MYKIYPHHYIEGYKEYPTITQNENEIPVIVDHLLQKTTFDKCCVIKNEDNTDEVYGVFYKIEKEKVYTRKK